MLKTCLILSLVFAAVWILLKMLEMTLVHKLSRLQKDTIKSSEVLPLNKSFRFGDAITPEEESKIDNYDPSDFGLDRNEFFGSPDFDEDDEEGD